MGRIAWRQVAIAAYVCAQAALLVWGLSVPDHVFGFQMFPESSRINVHLYREVAGHSQPVPIVDGAWEALGADGQLRAFRWGDRIRYRPLTRLDQWIHASYGLGAQLMRLQAALDDVAAHIEEDSETRALIARVEYRHNGRPEQQVELRSAPR